MARKSRATRKPQQGGVEDFRHTDAKRKNNPPAGLAPTYETRERQTTHYAYDPHLDPQLQWAGKAEHTSFEVDVVSLHIHERISTRAILEAVQKPKPLQFDLFGETELPADKQVEFYQHEVGWANRLILGDSLLVMNSLLVKEGMAGKVQMVYIDPPYGIKYSSNFQPRIDKRDVKDKDEDLTHEPEQIKAYRDTWQLGIHSYLTYLRDRLLLARELLAESGSIFVQINDENLHLVRCLLDEVFGRENFVAVISFRTGTSQNTKTIPRLYDFLIWYCRNLQEAIQQKRIKRLYRDRTQEERLGTFRFTDEEGKVFKDAELKTDKPIEVERLRAAERLVTIHGKLCTKRFPQDTSVIGIDSVWDDTVMGTYQSIREKVYAVQTNTKVVERCILMTTDPGDLVFDPTCVRKGTRVLVPVPSADGVGIKPPCSPPVNGGTGEGAGTPDTPSPDAPSPLTGRAGVGSSSPLPPSHSPSPLTGRAGVGSPSPDAGFAVPPCSPPVNGGTGEDVPNTPSPLTGRAGVGSPSPDEGFAVPPCSPPVNGGTGEGAGTPDTPSPHAPSPLTGRAGVGFVPIETLQPGDWVISHDGQPHRILRIICKTYRGPMVGILHAHSSQTLWVTADHRVLCRRRTQSYGAERSWRHVPQHHFQRARALRKEMTEAERRLWSRLRGGQLGVKFRKQHPIGPYIVDFYSWEAGLVVEVDGDTHYTPQAQAYDQERDHYLRSLGLTVLRFTNPEIRTNLSGVVEAIEAVLDETEPSDHHEREWRRADSLRVGDIIYFGPELRPVEITHLFFEQTEEEVYDLEVEGAHSYLTEVCAVHNCGSGTTAYCAEKWGRRWITCDTSRVALAIARQRLMTAKFDYYELKDPERGPTGGFIYETVPHITLESIAKNTEIDTIAEKYQPQIEQALADLNTALGTNWQEWEVPREVPHPLWSQEAQKAYQRLLELKNEATPDPAETQRLLDTIYQATGHLWKTLKDVPDPIPAPDWSDDAKEALRRFWELKRQKRKEIDESIQRNAPQETLYDRPQVVRGKVRVSGPFTVEAIPVPMVEDPTQIPIEQYEAEQVEGRIDDRAGNYIDHLINLIKQQGGVLFPNNKRMELKNVRPISLGYLHAEAETGQNGTLQRVAISFGPQYGPVPAHQVQEAIPTAKTNGYSILLFAGFSFDPSAQEFIQKIPVVGLQVHFVSIAPDVLVGDLLKTNRASQIFTVFGQPDVSVKTQKDGTYVVELRGVDIYDPITGEVHSESGDRVAAWFLDTDYDGKTFHICQAFFPGDPDAWEKLQKALKAQIDPEAFEKMRGTTSFPFELGQHKRIAVKVIDFRGNEVMRVIALGGAY